MKLKIYQIDAFTDRLFSGNPAAVCPLDYWISEELMQKIAMENNLAETAFYVKVQDHYEIRWFTPNTEVDLCGHATLATAFVLFNLENYTGNSITFQSLKKGTLTVTKNNDLLSLDFPTDSLAPIDISEEILKCFDKTPLYAYQGNSDYLLVFKNEQDIIEITPNFNEIKKLGERGIIITAKGTEVDFVSRFFAPQCGIDEDPVTGSAHTTLIPYWSNQLQKNELKALQLSSRGGYLSCKNQGERVTISGKAQLYLAGTIFIPEQ